MSRSWSGRRSSGGRIVLRWSFAVSLVLSVVAGSLPAAGVARPSNVGPMVAAAPKSGQAPEVKMMWGRSMKSSPSPQPGKRTRTTVNAVILEKAGKYYREVVRPANVRVTCEVVYSRGWKNVVKRLLVPGGWRSDVDEYGGEGEVRCGPWTVLKRFARTVAAADSARRLPGHLASEGRRGGDKSTAARVPNQRIRRYPSPSCHASRAARSIPSSPAFGSHRRPACCGARSASHRRRPARHQRVSWCATGRPQLMKSMLRVLATSHFRTRIQGGAIEFNRCSFRRRICRGRSFAGGRHRTASISVLPQRRSSG